MLKKHSLTRFVLTTFSSDSEAESDDSDEDPYTDTEWTPRRYKCVKFFV